MIHLFRVHSPALNLKKNDKRDLLLSAALSWPLRVFVFEGKLNHKLFLNELHRIYRICRISKIFLQKRCIRTCYLLSNKPWYFHSARTTRVTEKIFKMNLFMLQWFLRFSEFTELNESSFHLGKNSINLLRLMVVSPLKNNHTGAPA